MPNRDYEDSQYNRSEGRFENRDEWRDQSNAGSRDWDRRGDDFRQSESRFGQRSASYDPSRSGYQSSSYGSERDSRYRQGEYGRSAPYGQESGSSSYDQDFRLREGNYGGQDYRSSSNQDWRTQQTGQQYGQDWRSQQSGQIGQSGSYGQDWRNQQSSGQDYRGGQRNFNQDWRTQGFNQDWRGRDDAYRGGQDWGRGQSYTPDYYRSQSNYGARDFGRTQGYGNFGPFGSRQGFGGAGWRDQDVRERDEESWGQQIRQVGQQMARSVKRAFRGPKGYRRSDERIREDVSDRLAAQDELDPSDIEVTVSNGEVTLTGTVQGRHEKFLAEEIADDISGVNEVHNQLRVRREEIGTSATSQTSTGTTTGQSETTLRNRNARA